MNVIGKLKVIKQTEDVGSSGFQKRDCVVTTDEQYPQDILIQFMQDKCNLLDQFQVGNSVSVDVNLRGKLWTNPQGVDVYFNTIQGWRISLITDANNNPQTQTSPQEYKGKQTLTENLGGSLPNDDDDLPF